MVSMDKGFFDSILYERLLECIEVRKEIRYGPIYKNVEELLSDYGYDEQHIKMFLTKASSHTDKECTEI